MFPPSPPRPLVCLLFSFAACVVRTRKQDVAIIKTPPLGGRRGVGHNGHEPSKCPERAVQHADRGRDQDYHIGHEHSAGWRHVVCHGLHSGVRLEISKVDILVLLLGAKSAWCNIEGVDMKPTNYYATIDSHVGITLQSGAAQQDVLFSQKVEQNWSHETISMYFRIFRESRVGAPFLRCV